jgi:hypothetical protein
LSIHADACRNRSDRGTIGTIEPQSTRRRVGRARAEWRTADVASAGSPSNHQHWSSHFCTLSPARACNRSAPQSLGAAIARSCNRPSPRLVEKSSIRPASPSPFPAVGRLPSPAPS